LNNSNNNSLIIRNISVHHSTLIDEDQNDTFNPPAIEIEENKLASIDSCYLFENQKSLSIDFLKKTVQKVGGDIKRVEISRFQKYLFITAPRL
jgi:pectate lyase